jgi:hypothetical protein
MSMASLMNTFVSFQTETQTKSAAGLDGRSWVARSTDVPSRHCDLSGEDIIAYGRLGYQTTDAFYFSADPCFKGIEAKSRILWDGNAYYVMMVQNQGGSINKVWKVVTARKPLAYSAMG